MERAEYPQKTCREPLFNAQGLGYTCELVLLHPGPCASFSVKESVGVRRMWEETHPDWHDQIGNLDIEV